MDNIMEQKTVTARLHSIGTDTRDLGTIDFEPLDEDECYWNVNISGPEVLPFFREVWPYITMGELGKMPSYKMPQVMWSAYGYGVTVRVKGDLRW